MIKRQNQIDAFSVSTETRDYIVTLERLNNDRNGNPRYKAVIIFTEDGATSFYNAVYTFTGHYYGERKEAEYIVKHYEEERAK